MAAESERNLAHGGYWQRLLAVDLSARRLASEVIDGQVLHDTIGGYGLGARLLLSRMRAHTPPLDPASLLGILTGPLSGTAVPTATRFTVVGRSPLTGTWGDANCGGRFAAALRGAGLDAVLIGGEAESPVYVLVEGDTVQLRDARELWGLDTYAVDEQLRASHGSDACVVCIGPAGERRSLTSAIITDRGRAAARSGLGAIMGAKNLKAIVARGSRRVPVAQPERLTDIRRACLHAMNQGFGSSDFCRTTGTPGYVQTGVRNGDAPIRNWGGTPGDMPDTETLSPTALLARRRRRYACHRCPLGCGGWWEVEGEAVQQPEYETIAAFGPLCLNADVDSIARANDLCNRYGLDTISTGAAVAFAIECFEHGLLRERDLEGLRLAWGNGAAIVRLTEMIARRQAFGAVLADGLAEAVRQLGPAAGDLAVHIRGEALPMHDPRFEPGLAIVYALDPTPARHTQANQMEIPPGLDEQPLPRRQPAGRGRLAKRLSYLTHVANCAGLCLFGLGSMTMQDVAGFLAAVTGWERNVAELEAAGKHIADLRHAFNLREGIDLAEEPFPGRALGRPAAAAGPWRGLTIDLWPMAQEYRREMGWLGRAPAQQGQQEA